MDAVSSLKRLIEEIRAEHAPDPRTAVFEVGFDFSAGTVTLMGATSEAGAAEALHREAAAIDGWDRVVDEVERLPTTEPGESIHALATSAVVPLLAGPTVAEPHVSQALLGSRLTILRRAGRWLQCRAADGYIGWAHRGYLHVLDEAEARAWEIGADGEALVSLGAELRDAAGELVMRLPWGARIVRWADGSARLPDGRSGTLSGDFLPLKDRPHRFRSSGEQIVESAAHWLGAPYLWGGVTPAGVDCSGFVQALFHLHGIQLPRDSDQQARTGELVETDARFSKLLPGDLLFFAETPHRVSHVTLSLGASRIIHSSLGNGGVLRNDVLGDLPYERELRQLFVCARRYV